MSTSGHHELFTFLQTATDELAAEYQRIHRRARQDPGTAGDEGEENWATVLRKWLPPSYPIVTKGRILNHEGKASSQVDVLVLAPTYPPCLVTKKLYLAGGVLAAFECKLTVDAADIRKAVATAASIADMTSREWGSPFRELCSPIIFGLLAHSHSWKAAGSLPLHNIESVLTKSDREIVRHPRQVLDVLCVSDLATWTACRDSYTPPTVVPHSGAVGTAFIGFVPDASWPQFIKDKTGIPFTPVGSFVCSLLHKLAWRAADLRPLAEYFDLSGAMGTGGGVQRSWTLDVYSSAVRRKLEETGQVLWDRRLEQSQWDEWAMVLR